MFKSNNTLTARRLSRANVCRLDESYISVKGNTNESTNVVEEQTTSESTQQGISKPSQTSSSVNNNIGNSGDKNGNSVSSESSMQSVNGVSPSTNNVVNNSNGLQDNKSESTPVSGSSNVNGANNSAVESPLSGRPEGGRAPEANTTNNNGSGNPPDSTTTQSDSSSQPATTQSTTNNVFTPSTPSVIEPPITQPNTSEPNHGVGNGNGVGNSKH